MPENESKFLEERRRELRILEARNRLNLKERLEDDNYNNFFLNQEHKEIQGRIEFLENSFFSEGN